MLSRWYRVAVLLAAACATALMWHAVLAQGAPDRIAHIAGIRLDRHMLEGPVAPNPRLPSRGIEAGIVVQELRDYNLLGSSVLLEAARVGPDGTFVRPRLLIGRQSPELNAWMKSMGVTPERCMLPVFRGRLNRDPETGRFGAAVVVSARCTFY